MFYIRYKMFNMINDLSYLDKEIERINDDKKILTIELTYLTSTERLLSLIDTVHIAPIIIGNEGGICPKSQL